MKYFESVLDSAIKRCDTNIIYDQSFNKGFHEIYPFTTKNISGYINYFDLKQKIVNSWFIR